MNQTEPPSQCASLFRIGRNAHGNWVVLDEGCTRGGLFVDRTEALKYAMFENGNRPQAVVMVPGVLEFSTNGKAAPDNPWPIDADIRRVA